MDFGLSPSTPHRSIDVRIEETILFGCKQQNPIGRDDRL
jgi:hypothetical protein